MKENISLTDAATDSLTKAHIVQTRSWKGFHRRKNVASIFSRQTSIQVFQNCCMRIWKSYQVWRIYEGQLVALHSKSTYKLEDIKAFTQWHKRQLSKMTTKLLNAFSTSNCTFIVLHLAYSFKNTRVSVLDTINTTGVALTLP